MHPRLGVNIDHVATLRQLRKTPYPDLLAAAKLAESGGAQQITVHLREDRRHIQDEDVRILRRKLKVLLNLEMAVTPSMVRFATQIKPDWVCLVPEKRQEVTTEGGLDVVRGKARIAKQVKVIRAAKIRVSCFIEPDLHAVQVSREMGADAVEFHTGRYCLATQGGLGVRSTELAKSELKRLQNAALFAQKLGLHVHAGHGFDYQNVKKVAQLRDPQRAPLIEEYNIGHAIVCRAVTVGLKQAVHEMALAIR